MPHKLKRLKLHLHPHRLATAQVFIALIACVVISTMPVSAVIRFQYRSLMINDSQPGATTTYTLSMQYTTQTSIGSLDMKFCINPIPYMPCDAPPGLDLSHAQLASQTGETGYTMQLVSANHIILTRTPTMVQPDTTSTYVFTGVVNPTYKVHSYSIRLADYASTNATGTLVDLGSVIQQVNDGIILQTQVPPLLLFCLATTVELNCASTDGGNYRDLGTLDPADTLVAQSQMSVATNASQGYAVTVNGTTMSAGTHTIPASTIPTPSLRGTDQFGINLTANTDPELGMDPDGSSINAQVDSDYAQPNRFLFRDGDVVAGAPNVSLLRRFTVSYIVNSSPKLHPGVYSTTLTFICSGRF